MEIIRDRYKYALLKTGQTTQYESRADDGYYEKGFEKAYTILTTGQYASTTNITINSKTHALSNNCIIDNNTGLMWARYAPNADIGCGATPDGKLWWSQWTLAAKTTISFDSATKQIRDSASGFIVLALPQGRIFTLVGSTSNNRTFTVSGTTTTTGVITVVESVTDEGAGQSVTIATTDDLIWNFLDQANTSTGLASYTDWRIPNKFELESLLKCTSSTPTINTTVFPSAQSAGYWTSTSFDGTSGYYISLSSATSGIVIKKHYAYYCRLVRSGPN